MDEIRALIGKARTKRRGGNRPRAHIEEREDLSTDEEDFSSGAEDDEAFPARTQASSRKTPMSRWIADTGASAHMTDQLSLFKGPLKPVKARTVRGAGDSKLDIKGAGSVRIQTKGGEMTLSNVLYVPDLGVSLLSGSSLCDSGLLGSFNKRALYMRAKDGSLVLKAVRRNGIYMVN